MTVEPKNFLSASLFPCAICNLNCSYCGIDKNKALYEVDKILNDMGMSRLEVNTDLKEGTLVKVISGPFSGMEGKIDSVDKDNNKLTVLLDLFGQETSVEVDFSQIEKINK